MMLILKTKCIVFPASFPLTPATHRHSAQLYEWKRSRNLYFPNNTSSLSLIATDGTKVASGKTRANHRRMSALCRWRASKSHHKGRSRSQRFEHLSGSHLSLSLSLEWERAISQQLICTARDFLKQESETNFPLPKFPSLEKPISLLRLAQAAGLGCVKFVFTFTGC